MKEVLSSVSFIASILYLYVGIYVYRLNKKSTICKLFMLLNIVMAIWSFACFFTYNKVTPSEYSFWSKLSAVGWCSFSSLILYLIMTITENKLIKYWYIKLIVILPAPIFLFIALFLLGPTIDTNTMIEVCFYTGNILYNTVYLFLSILLLFLWGMNSKSSNQKKQTTIIITTSTITLLLNLISEVILPSLGINNLPNMGHIYSLAILWGVYYAIVRFQFMSIPTALVTKELFKELAGLAFLIDTNGKIIKANKQTFKLLDYSNHDIINKQIGEIISNKEFLDQLEDCETMTESKRFKEVYISPKSGPSIPFELSLSPLINPKSKLFLGLLIMGQDNRTTKTLKDEIVNHKHTYEKLRNSEELFRTIIEIVPFSIILTSRKDSIILYLNEQCEVFFKTKSSEMIGTNAYEYYKNPNDRQLLIHDIDHNIPIREREIIYLRKDGLEVPGLITMVPAIYQNQEVVLSYINDITEQRKLQQEVAKSEKTLKELMFSIPDMIMVTDIKGNITFVNNSFCTIMGYETDQNLFTIDALTFVAPKDKERAKKNMATILLNPIGSVEYTLIKKSDELLTVEVNGTVLRDDKNVPFEVIYVIRDVTERKQVEATLKQNSKKIFAMNKELLQMNDILKNKSTRDSLTNLFNHQYMNELLESELLKVSYAGEDLCVMMLDIDFFKRVNDTFGHQTGDKILVTIANLILHNSRSMDLIGRYGGEEFIAVLPNVNIDTAYLIAERIRLSVQNYDFGLEGLEVTISIGLAQYDSGDAKTLVNKADSLLYQSKSNGRNRTTR